VEEEGRHELGLGDAEMGDGGEESREGEGGVRDEDYGAREEEGEGEEFDHAGYWVFVGVWRVWGEGDVL
jgi:hypothetical protein